MPGILENLLRPGSVGLVPESRDVIQMQQDGSTFQLLHWIAFFLQDRYTVPVLAFGGFCVGMILLFKLHSQSI